MKEDNQETTENFCDIIKRIKKDEEKEDKTDE
jgi:hypothetical protein